MASASLALTTLRRHALRRVLITPVSTLSEQTRSISMHRPYKPHTGFIPPLDAVKPPVYWDTAEPEEKDPSAYPNNPITSAYAIDTTNSELSTLDTARVAPEGGIIHGRYGKLPPEKTEFIPLEYLPLLHPAAEGAAALKSLEASNTGTLLVFGATQPAGMAALQLADARGLTVCGVVGGEHSGNPEMVDTVKCMVKDPGCVVTEEYAIVKGMFRDLVNGAVNGEDGGSYSPESFLKDFKENLKDYIEMFPTSLPAAIDKNELVFKGKDRDREHWKANISTYLEQFPEGSAPISDTELERFDTVQYNIWKSKFNAHAAAQLAEDNPPDLIPSNVVKTMCTYPETPESLAISESEAIPYKFSIFADHKTRMNKLETKKGGSIVGAVIAVTPYLKKACEAVAQAKTLRAKVEALQFLPTAERNAFAGARSVVALAERSGAKVVVVGGELPGFESVTVASADVDEALDAMNVKEDGTSDLNYFVQVYKAGDHPFYADYAVHRAKEPLSGPRQIVVTK